MSPPTEDPPDYAEDAGDDEDEDEKHHHKHHHKHHKSDDDDEDTPDPIMPWGFDGEEKKKSDKKAALGAARVRRPRPRRTSTSRPTSTARRLWARGTRWRFSPRRSAKPPRLAP